MPIQAQSINQYDIHSSKNDEFQSTPQMILFEAEFESTEKQISHLENVFKFYLTIIANLKVENENK
jgi:hypothetical protein